MGLEFLTRVRRTSVVAGFLGSLAALAYLSIPVGVGFAAGLVWSLFNLALIEQVVLGLTAGAPGPRPRAALRRLALALVGSLVLFGAGAWLLTQLPPLALVAGFTLPFAVIVLKAASRMVLASPAWLRVTRSAWTGVAVLSLAIGGAWLGAQVLRPMLAPDAFAADPHTTTTHAADAHVTDAAHATDSTAHAAAGHDSHGEGGGHGGESAGPKGFPNFLGMLIADHHGEPWADFLHHFEYVIFAMLVALVLSVVAIVATRNPKMIPTGLQNVVEMGVENAYSFFVGILGPRFGPPLVPFLGTLFLYIWAMNFFGTIPFMHSPTSNLNITVAMALTVFAYVQFIGFKELGFFGYFFHLMGSPKTAIDWGLVPLMLPVHVIGEIAKPISLSCRLFGNIFGEDMLLVGFATLGVTALSGLHLPIGIPLQVPFMFLGVFITQPVQALVFTMLSTIYFLLMLPHDHGHGHGHGHGHEGEAHQTAH